MNEQVKEKWLSSLRSGDYQQTRLHLREGSGFCCLGVLCDLYGKEHNVEWELMNDDTYYEFQGQTATLPSSVIEWAALKDHDFGSGIDPLSALNDGGSTFNEIADLIEEHL